MTVSREAGRYPQGTYVHTDWFYKGEHRSAVFLVDELMVVKQ